MFKSIVLLALLVFVLLPAPSLGVGQTLPVLCSPFADEEADPCCRCKYSAFVECDRTVWAPCMDDYGCRLGTPHSTPEACKTFITYCNWDRAVCMQSLTGICGTCIL